MSAGARAVLGEHLMFCLPPGEQMLGYPVPGRTRPSCRGDDATTWYGSPAEEATALTGRDGRRYDLSIPPGQVAEGAVAELNADADTLPHLLRRGGASEPATLHPGDLRPREPAAGVRPGDPDRRCGLRHEAAYRNGGDQGRARCADPRGGARRAGPRCGARRMAEPAAALWPGGGRARALARRVSGRPGGRRGTPAPSGNSPPPCWRDGDLGLAARVGAFKLRASARARRRTSRRSCRRSTSGRPGATAGAQKALEMCDPWATLVM